VIFSNDNDHTWIEFDLGVPRLVSQVIWNSPHEHTPERYQYLASMDGKQWRVIHTVRDNQTSHKRIDRFYPLVTRYIRMRINQIHDRVGRYKYDPEEPVRRPGLSRVYIQYNSQVYGLEDHLITGVRAASNARGCPAHAVLTDEDVNWVSGGNLVLSPKHLAIVIRGLPVEVNLFDEFLEPSEIASVQPLTVEKIIGEGNTTVLLRSPLRLARAQRWEFSLVIVLGETKKGPDVINYARTMAAVPPAKVKKVSSQMYNLDIFVEDPVVERMMRLAHLSIRQVEIRTCDGVVDIEGHRIAADHTYAQVWGGDEGAMLLGLDALAGIGGSEDFTSRSNTEGAFTYHLYETGEEAFSFRSPFLETLDCIQDVLVHFAYSGDRDMLLRQYEHVRRYVRWVRIKCDPEGEGIAIDRGGSKRVDWGDTEGNAVCQMLYDSVEYYRTMDLAARIAAILGRAQECKAYSTMRDRISANIRKRFWDERLGHFIHGYYNGVRETNLGTQSNLLTIRYGLADEAQAKSIVEKIARGAFRSNGVATIDPPLPYPERSYFRPGFYQNGGQWPHITAEFMRACFSLGMDELGRNALEILARQLEQDGIGNIYEWYDERGSVKTSAPYNAWHAGRILWCLVESYLGLEGDGQTLTLNPRGNFSLPHFSYKREGRIVSISTPLPFPVRVKLSGKWLLDKRPISLLNGYAELGRIDQRPNQTVYCEKQ
jgi:hypothetical protein